jgi:hypothetical protein
MVVTQLTGVSVGQGGAVVGREILETDVTNRPKVSALPRPHSFR